jgi:predicted DsbA family dithiol-disulfide isomerase
LQLDPATACGSPVPHQIDGWVAFPRVAALGIEVYSDVVCPWCYIGKRRLERALATLEAEPDFPGADVAYRPFQLDPHAPRGRAEPVLDVYARKFGGPARAAAMVARVTEAASAEGIEFRLDRAVRPNTADAHRLLWWALRNAGADTQRALNEELMAAYFTDGADVGDTDVLVDRAARCGLNPTAARGVLVDEDGVEALAVALRNASDLGITAVPTFVVNSRWSIPGAQDVEYFVDVLRRASSR